MQNENPSPRKRLLRPVLILPEEVIEEILLKLEVKSLLRFRCVSRSWLSLVNSDRFVKLHLKTSTQNTTLAHHRAVFFDLNRYVLNRISLPSFLKWIDDGSSSSSSSSSLPIIVDGPTNNPEFAYKLVYVLGCCNGLVCLRSTNYNYDSFWLWNPTTRVSVELPKLGLGANTYSRFGFGWDESSGAFKVFAAVYQSNDKEMPIASHVYSSKTNSWKKIVPKDLLSCIHMFGLFVGGRLHWVISHRGDHGQRLLYAIESFNLENDEFGMIDLPPPLYNANAYEGGRPADTWLGEIGGCLFNLFNDYKKKHVDVWVMKEYGVMESWFKRYTFPLDHDLAASQRPANLVIRLPGEEGPNGEIFIVYGHTFSVYSRKGDQLSSMTTNIGAIRPYRAGIYVESLFSPTPTPTPTPTRTG